MIFTEALDAALSDWYRVAEVKRPATHRQGLTARMRALEKLHGGNGPRAAASAGIAQRTWRDWKAGTHKPSAKGLRKVEGAYARQVIRPQALKVLANRKPPSAVYITADVVVDPKKRRYKNSTPHRTFRAEKITAGPVVQAWMNHGAEAAGQALEQAIQQQYGQPFAFEGDSVTLELIP